MSETGELIVKFVAGVDEDAARGVVEGAGGKVRRRMRTDGPEEVMLLVRIEDGQLAALESEMNAHAQVEMTERNQGGFGIR